MRSKALFAEVDAGSAKRSAAQQGMGDASRPNVVGRSPSRLALLACLTVTGAALADPSGPTAAGRLGIGRPATPAVLALWDIDVRADGQGLPAGHGGVREGEALFGTRCAACHGARGEGAAADPLVGGRDTLATPKPVRTVGSYWPYATTLFDYIRRAMLYDAPQSLSADETYALSAYVLHLNGILPDDAVLDAASLPKVRMPNRDGFTADSRPDVPVPPR